MKKTLLLICISAIYTGIVIPCRGQQANTSLPVNTLKSNPFSKDITSKDVLRSAVFIENKGIYEPYQGQGIDYIYSHHGMKAFFTKQGVIYKLSTVKRENVAEEEKERKKAKKEGPEGPEGAMMAHYYYVQMQWEGANPDPKIVTDGKQDGDQIYMKRDGDSYTSIHSQGYQKIIYKDLYPGIDIEYTIPDKGGLEYNLIVHPGADVSQVKMTYSGDMKGLLNKGGDVVIKTKGGNITEHAPKSYYASNASISSPFHVKGKSIGFRLPDNYDRTQTLIIDPWVTNLTTLTSSEVGYIVDYDYNGNLFVYGGGGGTAANPEEYKVTKYPYGGGAPAYTFNGTVPAQNWNSLGIEYDPGSFAVDKPTGKVYVGQGVDAVDGTPYTYYYYYYLGIIPELVHRPTVYGRNQIIRIDSSGNYDNFISAIDNSFLEAWGFTYNCANSTILIAGGSYSSYINFGILNPVTATVAPINITGIYVNTISTEYEDDTAQRQDIASLAQNPQGDVFAVFSEPYVKQSPDVGNKVYKLNATLNGNVWNTPTGYNTLREFQNHPSFVNPEAKTVGKCTGNGYNGLAANNSYVFYYDGYHLEAFNATTGAVVGATTIPGQVISDTLKMGGIAVDNCNNVYVGGKGVINTFSFNGTTFTAGTAISLGSGYTTDYVNDVRYNSANNMIYATGSGFAGIYNATLSTTCVTNLLSIATQRLCTSAIVNLTPSNTVSNPTFTYVWTDTTGKIVSQTSSTALETDTLTGVPAGKYYIKAYMNLNCAASFQYDSAYVGAALAVNSNDTSICNGQSVTLNATADTAGGTFTWTPGGYTTPSISVTPNSSTTYTVTYSICNATDTARILISPAPTLSPTIATICSGDSISVKANPSIPGGTYTWSPGGYTTDSFRIAPTGNVSYQVVYSVTGCSSVSATASINVSPGVTLNPTAQSTSVCEGNSVQLSVTPSVSGGTYSWSPGGATTAAVTIAPTVDSVYVVTYSLNGCKVMASDTVTVKQQPNLSNTTASICSGSSVQVIADPSIVGGTYSWSPGGATTDSIVVNPTTNVTYTVTYNLNGCSATATHSVSVNPQPTLSQANISLCKGDSGQLTATPSVTGGAFIWSPGGATTGTITVAPVVKTTYTVTYTLNGCSATVSDTASIVSPPTLPGSTGTICSGDTVQIIANPSIFGGTYSWSPGGATTDTILANPTINVTYTITYNLNGCTATANHVVNVKPQPTLASSNLSLCPGNSGQLSATPSITGGTFSWSPGGNTTDTISVVPISGTYTVTYNLNGCSVTTTDTVSVLGTTSLPAYNVEVCAGTAAQLSVPSAPGATYSWSPGGATTATITVTPLVNSTYTVTYNLNGCSATATDTVSVLTKPNAGPDQTTVIDAIVTMAATGTGVWSSFSNNPTATTFADSTSPTTTVSGFTTDGVYGFIWTLNTCSDTILVTIGGSIPHAAYATNGSACLGGCIGFKNYSTNATGYQWYFPGGTPSSDTVTDPANICYDSAGTYSVTLIAYNPGLADTLIRNASITIYPLPVVTVVQQGDSLVATAGFGAYQWFLNGDTIYKNGTSQVYLPNGVDGNYFVQVTDSNGCVGASAPAAYPYTGIATITDDMAVEVYPNPLISGSWTLSVGNALIGSAVDIYDADGKRIYQSLVTDQHSLISLNIAPGVYFMHINSLKYSYIKKLIKL